MRFQTIISLKKALTSVGAFFRFTKDKPKPRKIALLFTLVSLVLILSPIWVFSFFSEKSPQEKIESARKLIAKAGELEAQVYAPKEYEQAKSFWNKAMKEWKTGNENSVLYKNFGSASVFADNAISKAEQAIQKAKTEKKKCVDEYTSKITELKKNAKFLERAFSEFPLPTDQRKQFTKYVLKIQEAEAAYQRNDILSALKILNSVENSLKLVKLSISKTLDEYFYDYEKWISFDAEMKRLSAQENQICLVVDKYDKICRVYKNGSVYKEFPVELGPNWMGVKKRRGDKATPEGKYFVTMKKSGKSTIYYKSLVINYPNQEDVQRFERAKRNGEIPANATIGNLIAIHGEGGKGINWTEGCVALENKHMDILFQLCPIGTPVAIVGSLKPLKQILVEE